jgi:hypothetical protein
MKRKSEPEPRDEAEAPAEQPAGRVVERPDGFYWQAKEGGEEYGPFETRAEAEADLLSDGEPVADVAAVHEAESELGISEWIDPESGEPAEDSVPRIEDH